MSYEVISFQQTKITFYIKLTLLVAIFTGGVVLFVTDDCKISIVLEVQ